MSQTLEKWDEHLSGGIVDEQAKYTAKNYQEIFLTSSAGASPQPIRQGKSGCKTSLSK